MNTNSAYNRFEQGKRNLEVELIEAVITGLNQYLDLEKFEVIKPVYRSDNMISRISRVPVYTYKGLELLASISKYDRVTISAIGSKVSDGYIGICWSDPLTNIQGNYSFRELSPYSRILPDLEYIVQEDTSLAEIANQLVLTCDTYIKRTAKITKIVDKKLARLAAQIEIHNKTVRAEMAKATKYPPFSAVIKECAENPPFSAVFSAIKDCTKK